VFLFLNQNIDGMKTRHPIAIVKMKNNWRRSTVEGEENCVADGACIT
jgi:hypothetical protein